MNKEPVDEIHDAISSSYQQQRPPQPPQHHDDSLSWCCRFPFGGNREALGYALDSMARATVFACWGAFFLPTLQQMATEATVAKCTSVENDTVQDNTIIHTSSGMTTILKLDCSNTENVRIHGIKPSSLLTTLLTIIGLISAALAPIVGAWVDTTAHRRLLGRSLSAVLCMLMIPTIFLQPSNWFAMAMLFMILSFGFWIHTLLSFSYLPELTNDPTELNQYTRDISICTFVGMVSFLVIIVGISAAAHLDDLTIAHLSQTMTFGLFAVSTITSWGFCFQTRPPARPAATNTNLWTAGFRQLSKTLNKIHQHYPALRWYYIGEGISNPAIGAMLVINMTFLSDVLQFTSQQVGICVTIMLLFCIPGAMLSSYLTSTAVLNPLQTVLLSLVIMASAVTLTAGILTGPNVAFWALPFAAAWGVGMGCNFTCDRTVIASLLPPGQDSELMGLYLFVGQALNWLPSLIYTTMNEAGFAPNTGVAMLNVFFGLGFAAFVCVGNYRDAVDAANKTTNDERRAMNGENNMQP